MSPSRWWARLGGGQRAVVAVVALVLGANLLVTFAGTLFGRQPSGPTASSYATGPDGLAALADLYASHGHHVTRLRRSLASATLDPRDTLVVAEPATLLGPDVDAVSAFVRGGGRLVAIGSTVLPLARELLDDGIRITGEGPKRWNVLAPVADIGGASSVDASGGSSWRSVGAALPVLGDRGHPTALVGTAGAGHVAVLVDSSPLQNRRIARRGNAALALGLAGPGRSVVFDEADHGYQTGPGALPSSWTRALLVALVAVLLLMWSVGRRFGPAEDEARSLPPPRRAYVDALAVSLARAREPAEALAPLQRRARRRLSVRLGLQPDATQAAVDAAARRAGISPEDVAALFEVPLDAADVVEIGRAAARQEGGSP